MGQPVAGPAFRDTGILDAESLPFKEQREKFPRRTGDRSENDASPYFSYSRPAAHPQESQPVDGDAGYA